MQRNTVAKVNSLLRQATSRHASTLARPAVAASAARLSAAVPLSAIPAHRAISASAVRCSAATAAKAAPKCPDNYKDPKYEKYVKVPEGKKIVILGFGAIGSGVLPLLFRHIDMTPSQVLVISDQYSQKQRDHAASYGVQLETAKLVRNDYKAALEKHLQEGDFLVNLSVDVSSCALIEFCQAKNVLYMDTCNEPWAGGYSDPNVSAAERTNYAFREEALEFRKKFAKDGPTALITHGANPGLVSHFVKQGLLDIARDTGVKVAVPTTREGWAKLAQQLDIKTIHISERDTQASRSVIKHDQEFVNTWSIEGYVEEGKQPAELGWGTHEKHWPHDGMNHDNGCKAAIYLNRPGAITNVRTWTPFSGSFHGMLITHTEAISIADYFTLQGKDGKVEYRPTVHFAYHACDNAWMSLHQVAGREWIRHPEERVMVDEIDDGRDELGVLLMGHKKGAYWYGSDLTIQKTRELVHYNNATSLQVCTGVLTGIVYAYENPRKGVVEPEEIEHQRIMQIGANYLGKLHGQYTDWTPLVRRNILFPEKIDESDPWQFQNFRVQ